MECEDNVTTVEIVLMCVVLFNDTILSTFSYSHLRIHIIRKEQHTGLKLQE